MRVLILKTSKYDAVLDDHLLPSIRATSLKPTIVYSSMPSGDFFTQEFKDINRRKLHEIDVFGAKYPNELLLYMDCDTRIYNDPTNHITDIFTANPNLDAVFSDDLGGLCAGIIAWRHSKYWSWFLKEAQRRIIKENAIDQYILRKMSGLIKYKLLDRSLFYTVGNDLNARWRGVGSVRLWEGQNIQDMMRCLPRDESGNIIGGFSHDMMVHHANFTLTIQQKQDLLTAVAAEMDHRTRNNDAIVRAKSIGFVTVEPTGGLGNRIRVLLSWLPVARKNGLGLIVIWSTDYGCTGEFLDAFKPINGVEFKSKTSATIENMAINYRGCSEYHDVLMDFGLLAPTEQVADIVADIAVPFIAVHVRRTDWLPMVRKARQLRRDGLRPTYQPYTPIRDYYKFIDGFADDIRIFLATDSRKVRRRFKKRYGDRVFWHSELGQDGTRQSSFNESVVDLFVCVKAQAFSGTGYSSFTGMICGIRKCNGV